MFIAKLVLMALASASMGSLTAAAVRRAPAYEVVHGWPVLPEGQVLGSSTGVGVDSNGNVLIFHRAG